MIKIENVDVHGWEAAIRGMRNPMNSCSKSDSSYFYSESSYPHSGEFVRIGKNDLVLMKSLIKAGSDHRKFLRFINVTCDIVAPLYWWKEFDTYKVGTVRNSCSTMHTIAKKEFTLDDFSHEHLINMFEESLQYSANELYCCNGIGALQQTIDVLNGFRVNYLETKGKGYWWQMIQLLPSSYNQMATVQLNYEVLIKMYHERKNHKLDEWNDFCEWVKTLPYMREMLNDG